MSLFIQVFLLFSLNFADAILTIFWVRNGFATEGNALMATLLAIGDLPFLMVKILVGALAAIVLWNWGHLRLAKVGLSVSLIIYVGLMGIHFVTGLSAMGLVATSTISDMTAWAGSLIATMF